PLRPPLASRFSSSLVSSSRSHRDLHSFPTRRSSDLRRRVLRSCARPVLPGPGCEAARRSGHVLGVPRGRATGPGGPVPPGRNWSDRKSTRLNSSHVSNSYAVFCLKKKISRKKEDQGI